MLKTKWQVKLSSPFLTIPRARSMIWPGSQQTMGELLDQDKRKLPHNFSVPLFRGR